MRPWFEGVVTWAHRRRALVFAAAACLLALSAFGLRRVTFDANVLHRLPATGEAVPAFRTFLERYGTLIASSYPPLRSIGIVSAVSVITLVAASVFVLPALLQRDSR